MLKVFELHSDAVKAYRDYYHAGEIDIRNERYVIGLLVRSEGLHAVYILALADELPPDAQIVTTLW